MQEKKPDLRDVTGAILDLPALLRQGKFVATFIAVAANRGARFVAMGRGSPRTVRAYTWLDDGTIAA